MSVRVALVFVCLLLVVGPAASTSRTHHHRRHRADQPNLSSSSGSSAIAVACDVVIRAATGIACSDSAPIAFNLLTGGCMSRSPHPVQLRDPCVHGSVRESERHG